MKKITFLVRDLSGKGGILRVVSILANELSKKNNVEIIGIEKLANKEFQYKFNENIKLKYLNIEQNGKGRKEHYIFVIKSFYALFKNLKKDKPDIIYSIFPFSLYIWIFKILKIKIIIAEHGTHKIYSRKFLLYLKFILTFIDKFVVLTDDDYSFYKNKLHIKNVEKITNPISFHSLEKSNLEHKRILTIGRLEDEKQQEDFIEVVSRIIEKYPDWNALIRGSGSQKNKLLNLIREKKMESKIEILDSISNIEEDYLSSSIFLLTSKYEGLSMVILEAMHCGLPIISYDCPSGPKELVENEKNGFLIENGNKEEMINRIELLLNNKKLLKAMGKESIRLSKKYDLKNIIKRWEKIL